MPEEPVALGQRRVDGHEGSSERIALEVLRNGVVFEPRHRRRTRNIRRKSDSGEERIATGYNLYTVQYIGSSQNNEIEEKEE